MAGQEAVSCRVIDERVISEPLDGTARGAGVAEGVPRWQQVRELLVEFVFETAESSPALDGLRKPVPGAFIGDGCSSSAGTS